jgi:hypothetical protein
MLQLMQQTVESAPSLSPSSFANLLAALAAPSNKTEPAWNDDGLEDDVTTLSYERALRTHARYRIGDPSDRSLTQPSTGRSVDSYKVESLPAAPSTVLAESCAASNTVAALDRNLKSASITIRMSTAECEQLRKRAAAPLRLSLYGRWSKIRWPSCGRRRKKESRPPPPVPAVPGPIIPALPGYSGSCPAGLQISALPRREKAT